MTDKYSFCTLTEEEIQKINAKTEEVGECLEWQGALLSDKRPYINARRDGKRKTISIRPAIARSIGLEVSNKFRTTMKCGNPICINPDHIVSKSVSAITKAAAKKNRNAWNSIAIRAKRAEIARERFGKLTPEAVEDIRSGKEPVKAYMERYGVSRKAVSEAKNFITHSPVLQKSNPWAGLFTGL